MRTSFIILCLLFISSTTVAQLPTEGVLTYKVDTVRRIEKLPGNFRLNDLVISYKNNGKLSKIYLGFPGDGMRNMNQIAILRDKEAYIVSKLFGDSLMVIQLPKDVPVSNGLILVKTDEIKFIKTLKCRKWLIEDETLKKTLTVWTLEQDDIQIPISRIFTEFTGLEGLPIAFDLEMSGWLLHAKLQKIERKSVSDIDFAIPEGTVKTLDDLMQEMKDFH